MDFSISLVQAGTRPLMVELVRAFTPRQVPHHLICHLGEEKAQQFRLLVLEGATAVAWPPCVFHVSDLHGEGTLGLSGGMELTRYLGDIEVPRESSQASGAGLVVQKEPPGLLLLKAVVCFHFKQIICT